MKGETIDSEKGGWLGKKEDKRSETGKHTKKKKEGQSNRGVAG